MHKGESKMKKEKNLKTLRSVGNGKKPKKKNAA